MEKILIDSDVVIDFLRGYDLRIKSFFSKIKNQQIKGCISLISIIELYSGIEEENNIQDKYLKDLLLSIEIIPVEFDLCRYAGLLRNKYPLSVSDSVIAASSVYFKIKLFTFNVKHFTNLSGIKLYTQ